MTDAQQEPSQPKQSPPERVQPGEPAAPGRSSGGGGGPEAPPQRYTAQLANEIEAYWQGAWEREGAFRQPNPGEAGFDASRPKFYCLDMFPYPSGAGLHVGHPEGYTATDILCRYKRMRGFNVLHPMGWDAFGLPAEQYAIQTGVHPSVTTRAAIDNFRRQLQRFGFSYDWSREFGTIDPDYYRWTQWIFLKIYDSWFDPQVNRARPISELIAELESGDLRIGPDGELAHIGEPARALEGLSGEPGVLRAWHELSAAEQRAFINDQRLAYIGEQVVNWCPKLGTALANEEVIDGRSERGGYPVLRKPLRQWMFRITAYAERLLAGLDEVDWPQSTRTQQAEWIGRSEGAEVDFALGTPSLRGGRSLRESEKTAGASIDAIVAAFEAEGLEALRPVGFVGRDPYPPGMYGPVRDLVKTQRNLPHLNLPDATYFVTWRTLDETKLSDDECDIVLRALLHFDGERCRVFAANVMNTHIHWIVRPFDGHTLDELVKSVKHFTAQRINAARGERVDPHGRVWDPERFDHIVRDRRDFNEFVKYVIENPVEAGIAEHPADYQWTFVHRDTMGKDSRISEEPPPAERGATQTFLRVFTTRPDTIFGATYMVVAPEHPIIDDVMASPRSETPVDELRQYVQRARNRSDVERQESKEKTGCFTGLYATNPATGEQIPVWCADYVLMGYGFGAIMAVPAHDERDFEFAQKFGLPIRDVVYTRQQAAIAFITRHASSEERDDNRWIATLADFMGITTSRDMGPDRFGEALNVLRERRLGRPVGATIDITPAKRPSPDEPGSIGERRGSTRMTWMQTIADLGMSTWAETAAQIEAGALCARAGAPNPAPGYAANSANKQVSLDGLPTAQAKERIIEWLEQAGIGRRKVNYRLRDWLFSRQRYWGEPFPIVWDEQGNHHPVDESALPVVLPELADYAPIESEDPLPLLAKATDWVHTTAGEAGVTATGLPPETPVRRETNTMPGWAGSCWYFLRFCDPKNQERFVGEEAERYWMGGEQGGSAQGRSALRADRSFHASSILDHLPEDRIRAKDFVPRDPYPPGEYGPARDLIAYARRLPHFEMEGATYFVTWSTKGGRKLEAPERDEALSALLHFDDERCRVYAACVMPDHVHWIVRPFKGQKLGDLVASVKRYSAGQINKASGSAGSIWQPDRFDHIVRDGAWLARFVRYVVENPVEAGLVERPSAYSWTALHSDVRVAGHGSTARTAGVAEVGSERRPTQGGVDLYIGGAEHAVLHLLYARFWHMALYDMGYVSTREPFRKLFHQGLITSHAYQDASGRLTPIDEVEQRGDKFVLKSTGEEVRQIVAKMSKTLKNVVNPDDIITEYGADTFRLYEMYMGPLEASKPWDTRAIAGLFRFLQRAWRLLVDEQTGEIKLANVHNSEIEKKLHRTTAKVGQDIENLAFNTAIAAMIELVNAATSAAAGGAATGESGPALTRDQAERFCLLLAPLAPHMAEEIAQKLGWDAMVTTTGAWPAYDESQLRDDEVEIAVQLMGKVKARIMAPADIDADALRELALSHAEVAPLIEGKTVRKVVAVPGRLVNIVAN